MKLPGGTKCKISKDEFGKNLPCLEITECVLVHCNIVNNDIDIFKESCIYLFLINRLISCWIFYLKTLYFVFSKSLIQSFHTLKYG